MPTDNLPPPFGFDHKQQISAREFNQLVVEQFAEVRDIYISPDNNLEYSHGGGWQTDYPNSLESDGTFKQYSSYTDSMFEDVVNHDVSALVQNLKDLVESMSDQFQTSFFDMISETTKRTGNVVSVKESGSGAKAFLEMIETVEFGVDRNGNVTLPSIHMGAGNFEKLNAELDAEGPEFSQKIEAVKATKSEAALSNEAERRSKFVTRKDVN